MIFRVALSHSYCSVVTVAVHLLFWLMGTGGKTKVFHGELVDLGGKEINSAYWLKVTHMV